MSPVAPLPGFRSIRHDQLREEREHDSYKQLAKPPEPTVCPDCHALFHAGRWQWGEAPAGAYEHVCPACRRIHDHFPAGFVHLGGAFFGEHREEILNLVRHHEEKERNEHPLARVMAIEDDDRHLGGALLTTTDLHLARDLGEALHSAYGGELDFHFSAAEQRLRVYWSR